MSRHHDIFPVFDPVSGNHIGYKPRHLVHTEGDWHRGVHAHVVRPNSLGTFDILIQQRADGVDLAAGKYDNSVATQMTDQDDLDEEKAVRRGLMEELGLTPVRLERLERELRIVKTYREHPGALNRELITLFGVVADRSDDELVPMSPKVARVEWLEWSQFLRRFKERPSDFTKTFAFYFSDPVLLHETTLLSYRLTRPDALLDHSAGCILHIDRAESPPRTYRGPVADCLQQAGESRRTEPGA
ncbi:NUDIX domain-containing protein [Streptomyces sp. NPDC059002]|uniref:NUDIX domain-containing protein n=1 Tax=Streptomyces sp. NPDC059002 TaxID=3346690 RepID=UPI00369E5D3E